MPGLMDVIPAAAKVAVGDVTLEVRGVSAKGVAYLLGRFPELRALMAGREVPLPELMAMGGDAVAAIIAAGCGYPGDEAAEQRAGEFAVDAQADLLAAILKLTMPNGVAPFVEKLTALAGAVGDDQSTKALAQKSGKQSTTSSRSDTTKAA